MRIPGSSVESLILGELEKGHELVELKRKGPPDTYSVKYRVSSCSMRLWKEYCRNNFEFKKTPIHKRKKPNPIQQQKTQPKPPTPSGFRGLESMNYTEYQP